MSNQSLKLISRLRPTSSLRTPLASRSLHWSSQSYASKPAHEPSQTQGHATKKSHETLHKDADFQSASVRAGQQAKESAQNASGSADNEPFDAASQGSTGGQTKPGAGKGPFKDQNGGQDVPGKGPGVKGGKQEAAAGGSIRETLSNSFESLKQMRKDGKNFSTSARVSDGTTPRADAKGSREPKDTSVKGDQNSHLKHTEGGSQGGKKQGNASADPSLPSKNKKTTSAGSSSTPSRAFSTSLRAMADPNAPGMGGPGPAEKEAQKNAGVKQQPRGSDTQHGGAAGGPKTASSGSAPESSPNPTTGTAAPNPEIPSSQKGGKTQAGMGVRKFSTSARALADPNAPGVGSPGPAEKEAQKNAGIKQQPRGSDVEHGGAAGGPTTAKSGGAPESAPNPTSGTAAPNPEIPGSQKGGATRDGMGVRKFSTTARRAATTPPGGYAKAVPHEASEAGYNTPPTALPGNLKSAYEEHDPNAIQRTTGEKASSNLPHSSTAVDPPNEALRQKVLDGEMHEMNRQPDGEIGKMGNEEAWKHRK